jgi:hypothetical protein
MKNNVGKIFAGVFISAGLLFAQEDSAVASQPSPDVEAQIADLNGKISGIEESYLETKGTVNKLAKIKVSGYLQTQIRTATDTTGRMKSDYTNNYDIGEFQGG